MLRGSIVLWSLGRLIQVVDSWGLVGVLSWVLWLALLVSIVVRDLGPCAF